MGLLLNALNWMKNRKDAGMLNGDGFGNGKEFVPGKKKLRSHCEPWTMNGTTKPNDELCAVLCRSEASCVGFARDPESHWCVWFDETKAQSADVCSSQVETKFIKRWQAPVNQSIWTAVAKLHVFDKAIIEALRMADIGATSTDDNFNQWWHFPGTNKTVRLALKDHFMKDLDNYTGTIFDTGEIRKQYAILQKSALEFMVNEAEMHPPLDAPPPVIQATPAPMRVTEGFKAPVEDPPDTIRWKDFPNSDDTAWSRIHPDCPMGVPCVCDCKCRGAPPQNFVEPPALPPPPCPLPPLPPNPAMLTAILR